MLYKINDTVKQGEIVCIEFISVRMDRIEHADTQETVDKLYQEFTAKDPHSIFRYGIKAANDDKIRFHFRHEVESEDNWTGASW